MISAIIIIIGTIIVVWFADRWHRVIRETDAEIARQREEFRRVSHYMKP